MTDTPTTNLSQRMKRWTDAKLEKESYFAGPADDGGPECAAWNAAIKAEMIRRNAIDAGDSP